MTRHPAEAAPALKKLLRATGITPGNAFFPCRSSESPWCNPSVHAQDTLATCEVNTDHYFGSQSSAFICLRVLPAEPGRSFPTSCVISLSTNLQRMDELAMEDIIVKEWAMKPSSSALSDWVETTIAVKTVYHIANLLGREPTADKRVFLTLRFIGCCDASDMHRISAVELFYTAPPLPNSVPQDFFAGQTDDKEVEVELTLSPTPMRGIDRTLPRPTRSPPGAELVLPPERVIVVSENNTPRDVVALGTMDTSTPAIQVTQGGGDHWNEPEARVRYNERSSEGRKFAEPLDEKVNGKESSSCKSAEYEGVSQRSHASPSRRSATLPRRIVYLDAEKELENENEDSGDTYDNVRSPTSDGAVELLTSPCTTRSRSTCGSRSRSRTAAPAPIRLIEHSCSLDVSHAQPQTVPPECCTPFVVPDRRSFVPVNSIRTNRHSQSPYAQWGDDGTISARRMDAESRADVAEGRRRIHSLHDVPLCDVADDLLSAATALLGVDRGSLCSRSSRASSLSRVVSTSAPSDSRTNDRNKSKADIRSERSELQRLLPAEAAEQVPPRLLTPRLPLRSERAAPPPPSRVEAPQAPRRWRSLVEDPRAQQMPKPEKRDEAVSHPLVDRTAELNCPMRPKYHKTVSSRTERKNEFTVVHANASSADPGAVSKACDESLESAAGSDGPELVVQVEPPMPTHPVSKQELVFSASTLPSSARNSMNIASEAENYAPPVIGTFLVWKHHASRTGTAKRILSLQRDGDCVRVTLNKMERSKKLVQTFLRPSDGVKLITSLQAYHSNVIHAERVRAAECCLVVTRGGELVMAVEMQCVDELRFATQILSHVCKVSAT